MQDLLITVLLGIVEGITEFVPISSTGHLLIAEHALGARKSDLFNVVIQSGAVLAVIPVFHPRLKAFISNWSDVQTRDYMLKLLTAFVLTCAGGAGLEAVGLKLPEHLWPVAVAMLLGGVAFLLVEHLLKGRQLTEQITWTVAGCVALAQLVAAVFPGTSRSGASMLFCLLLGVNRVAATEFSFLVGIPTMLAAGGLKIFSALVRTGGSHPIEPWPMVVFGFVVSALVSFAAVKWLLGYVQTHTFTLFGWYRIGAATILVLLGVL